MAFASHEPDDFEMIDRQEAILGPDDLAKIQVWLQPTDYMAESSEFHRHLTSQAPGTGHWICETTRYRQWHDSEDHGSLWIKGVPGAGKSVIAASMVQYLRGADETPVLFFFFRYIIAANRNSRNLVRDWLAQLLPYSSRLQAILEPLSSNDLENISDEQLWEHLLAGLATVQKAYCIVDALDEMEPNNSDAFLRRLNGLATFKPGSVKLLMTSRPKEYLQSSLRDASIVHISLESDSVGKDIAVFVSYRLRTVLKETDQASLRDSLASTISIKSRGLFLYARLLLDQIIPRLASSEEPDIKNLASTLPIGLEDMYNSMLFQQAQLLQAPSVTNLGLAIQVFLLECVTHSSRPLRLNELANVLDVVFLKSIPGLDLASLPLWNTKQVTRNACVPLLEILEDGTVQVIHHSFTEFLLDNERAKSADGALPQFPVLNSSTAHRHLAKTCLEYLQSGCLKSNDIEAKVAQICDAECDHGDWPCPKSPVQADPYDYQQSRLHYPFLEYAVSNWPWHSGHHDVQGDELFLPVSEFLRPSNLDFQRWLILQWGLDYSKINSQIPSALHIAAFAGMTDYASSLVTQGQNVDSRDVNERTPLHWAAMRGHMETVSLLLQNGANPDPADRRGLKPLHLAAKNNNANIVQVLLYAGVDPITPKTKENHSGRLKGGEISTKGETAVGYVCKLGHTDSILAMIPFLEPETLEEVLCSCCRHGKSDSARAVLENSNVSPNARYEGATALFLATVSSNAKCVDMLLAMGADPNLTSEWEPKAFHRRHRLQKETPTAPLHKLAMSWQFPSTERHSIFRSLLNAGANLEATARCGETPLLLLFGTRSSGTLSCCLQALNAFLDAGADISAVGNDVIYQGMDASKGILQRLLEGNRDLDALKLILDHGANIHLRDKSGNNALHIALSWGGTEKPGILEDLVNLLLKKGVQAHAKNHSGQTPLEVAVGRSTCSLQVLEILLRSCLDSEARIRCLSLARFRQNEKQQKFIQMLLSTGISLESRDKLGATPLLRSVHSQDVFQILIDHGAKLDAEDDQERGVLHYFIQSGRSKERLQSLVQLGLDPKKSDKDGNTLLHIAAVGYDGTRSSVQFIQQLLEYGLSPNSKNIRGSTPAHIHATNSRILSSHNEKTRLPLLELFQNCGDFDIDAQDNDGLTLLHLATLRSETEVARVLAAGADLNILDKNGRSSLHLACRARKSNCVGLLVSKFGQEMIDLADSSHRTALHDACSSGRPESVYYLLRSGAGLKCKDSNGRTPLHTCAEFILEQSLWLLQGYRHSTHGQVPLDQYRPRPAARSDPWYTSDYRTEPAFTENDTVGVGGIVHTLLNAGADINAVDNSGRTALDLSLSLRCSEMTAALQSAHPQHKSLQLEGSNLKLQVELILNKMKSSINRLSSDPGMKEVLDVPSKYLSQLTSSDIECIVNYHKNDTSEPFYDEANLLRKASGHGLTEIVEILASRAAIYDTAPSLQPMEKVSSVWKPGESAPSIQKSHQIVPVLQVACWRELPNLEMLDTLINKCGVDVNARSQIPENVYRSELVQTQSTALHCLASASYFWQLDGIRFLVQHGADVNVRNGKGETALHIASRGPSQNNMGGHRGFWTPACVEVLLSLGADPNVLDGDSFTPLHQATSCAEIMKSLLRGGANIHLGKTSPLFRAIRNQNLETARLLLDAGCDLNAVTEPFLINPHITDQARTALFCASFVLNINCALSDSVPLIKLLIERGSNVYAPLNDRETLIHYVFEQGDYEAVCAFLDYHDKMDFNAKDQLGRTVLLAACNWDKVAPGYRHKHWFPKEPSPIIRLLDHGADLLAVSHDGRNALHHLLNNPDIEQDTILQILDREREKCKILMKQKDNNGFVPFQHALRILRPDVCFKLLDLGANLLEPDPTGATALHHIARQYLQVYRPSRGQFIMEEYGKDHHKNCLELWTRYLQLGGSINVRDSKGSPPLFSYLSSQLRDSNKVPSDSCCHVDNFATLFSIEDLDLGIRNFEGESALHVIARGDKTVHHKHGHDAQLFKFILKDLDPLAEDNSKRTALDVAAATGKEEILALFHRV